MVAGKMSRTASHENQHHNNRQSGLALIIVLVVLGLFVGSLAVGFTSDLVRKSKIEQQTVDALAKGKDALVGRAASDSSIPGSLPCPDLDNDGVAELFVGIACPGYVGRLPWRTLGLPDLRDGNGERLWYALSPNFRDHPSAQPLNSNTPGQLNITGNAPAANVIAIVFSPGTVMGNQVRDTANENNVVNYLEGENSNGAPPGDNTFATALASSTFNDKLLPITREALFPVVEMRVARELRLSLRNYYAANGFFPLAAQFPDNIGTPGTYRGYIPTTGCVPGVPELPTYLPTWFVPNNWQQVMVYAVAPRCTPKVNTTLLSLALLAPPPVCASGCIVIPFVLQLCLFPQTVDTSVLNCSNTTAGPYLTVDGVGGVEAAVLAASYSLGSQSRPCNNAADCLESAENIDADDYIYVKPARSSTNNDSLVIVGP
jgi:hypothetical protein